MREPDRSNLASFYDPDWRNGPDLEWRMEQAKEIAREQLDTEIDRVMNEISAGDHDSDLIESPLLDASTVMKVARERAQNLNVTFGRECDLAAVNNLKLQIAEYARDLAERRMLK